MTGDDTDFRTWLRANNIVLDMAEYLTPLGDTTRCADRILAGSKAWDDIQRAYGRPDAAGGWPHVQLFGLPVRVDTDLAPDMWRLIGRDGTVLYEATTGEATDETTPAITVRKLGAYIPVSCCQLTDATGVNHCEHPPPPPPRRQPWHRRLRWRVRAVVLRARYRLGCWIAGLDVDPEEDW
jgi:hypothetical protein